MVGQASRLSPVNDRQDAGPTGNPHLEAWEIASGFSPRNYGQRIVNLQMGQTRASPFQFHFPGE